MTDVTDIPAEESEPKKGGGKKGLLFGVALALILGGGGFYSVYSGLFDPMGLIGGGADKTASEGHSDGHSKSEATRGSEGYGELPLTDIAFVALEPIMISLPPGSSSRHLRFTGQLEVVPGAEPTIVQLMPRVQDVLNTYLRAVKVSDLEEPASAAKLRAQMLRRVQVVVGEGMVSDLLITEFVLN